MLKRAISWCLQAKQIGPDVVVPAELATLRLTPKTIDDLRTTAEKGLAPGAVHWTRMQMRLNMMLAAALLCGFAALSSMAFTMPALVLIAAIGALSAMAKYRKHRLALLVEMLSPAVYLPVDTTLYVESLSRPNSRRAQLLKHISAQKRPATVLEANILQALHL